MALDFGVSLVFCGSGDRTVRMTSRTFSGEVAFNLDSIPPRQSGGNSHEEAAWYRQLQQTRSPAVSMLMTFPQTSTLRTTELKAVSGMRVQGQLPSRCCTGTAEKGLQVELCPTCVLEKICRDACMRWHAPLTGFVHCAA